MRGKRRVLATLVIGELMFAFGEGGSSSEAIRDQDSTRVFRPVRAVSLTLPGGIHQTRATPTATQRAQGAVCGGVTTKRPFGGGRSGHVVPRCVVTRT